MLFSDNRAPKPPQGISRGWRVVLGHFLTYGIKLDFWASCEATGAKYEGGIPMNSKNESFYSSELYKWFLLGVAFAGTTSSFTNKPEAGTARINAGITDDGVIYIKRE